jgi:hypothetical protein
MSIGDQPFVAFEWRVLSGQIARSVLAQHIEIAEKTDISVVLSDRSGIDREVIGEEF